LKISQAYNQKEQEKIPKVFCALRIKGDREKTARKSFGMFLEPVHIIEQLMIL
jgi:hypothetical protein